MLNLVHLVSLEENELWHGNVLRTPGKYPYEKYVDFMVFETRDTNSTYGLMVTSGYKAGMILVYLPAQSSALGGGVSKEWVISNWNRWIYESSVSEVYF
ncbi:Imm45 family immunity protein [Pseudomonas sp. Marseille-Q5115]|uniref:Imm45 family immunity protein n=1 Tax=Pseudomonas sp. Marseille-Q5115 TaxID=2866593 RepID=UPI001CE410B8|nr:Imm45 family immunity protein [Pseudomonas sp. Marseille-Q5115]